MIKLLVIFLISTSLVSIDFVTEDRVYILTNESIKEFIKVTPHSLIFIHDKQCMFCDSVKQTFRSLMESTKNDYPDIRFGMIDVETEQDFKTSEDIEKTPQLRLYMNQGFFAFYDDEFKEANLKSFFDFHLKTKAEPTLVNADRSYIRYSNRANSIVISFPELTEVEADFALGLQKVVPDIPVYYMKSDSKYAYMTFPSDSSQSTHKMKMKRNFDEGDKFLGTRERFLPRHILQLVWPYRQSKIEVFSEKTVKSIFRLKKPVLLFFDEDYSTDHSEVFSKAVLGRSFPGLAVKCKLDEEGSEKLKVLFGVRRADFPAVRIVEWRDNQFHKYKMETDFTTENIEKMIDDFESKKLTSYKKNQKVDDNTGKTVATLNRELFYEQAKDTRTHFVHALVGKTGAVIEEFLKQTHALLKNKERFFFGIVDVNLNEIDGLNKKKIPMIGILTKSQRKRPIVYEGKQDPTEFAEYLNLNVDFEDEL